MGTLRIQPHGRLQEWVAHEKDYFADEGLDYEFKLIKPDSGPASSPLSSSSKERPEILSGAYELYEEGEGTKGEACDVSSACHWAVNQASTNRHGRMWGRAYSVTPGGICVPPESEIRAPEELAEVEIAAGYHSGSHFAALQALEAFLEPDQISLRYIGRPMARLDAALERAVPAVSVWGLGLYVLEQLGFRKIVDTTFMVGFLFPNDVAEEDIERFLRALRRAQMDIDLEPERYKKYYLNELPERFHDKVDVRRFGVGERIVFLPYSEEMYTRTQRWMQERRLFGDEGKDKPYHTAVQS